jgi:hypothetical protein
MKLLMAIAIGFVVGLAATLAQAADASLTRYGIQADVSAGLNRHTANFRLLNPPFPSCCVTFTNGSGIGYSLGAAITADLDARLNDQPVRLGTRLSWTDLSGSLVENEFFTYVIVGSNSFDGISRHTVSASYGMIGIEPFISASPLPSMPARLRLGALIGIPVAPTFAQREEFVEPTAPDVTFLDGSRVRNVYEGELPNTSTQVMAVVALSWPITTASGMEIAPELTYAHNLTTFTSSLTWSASALRLGASVRYAIPKPPGAPAPAPTTTAPSTTADPDGIITTRDTVCG